MREVMDPNVISVNHTEYATCGTEECDSLVLGWLGVDVSDLGDVRDVREVPTGHGPVSCFPLVVPLEADAFCAACGVFVMHGVFCTDAHHADLGAPHPDFADLI